MNEAWWQVELSPVAVVAGEERYELKPRPVLGEYDVNGLGRRLSLGDAAHMAAQRQGVRTVTIEFKEEAK